MSSSGRNKQSGKLANLRLLGDEERDKLLGTPRLPNGEKFRMFPSTDSVAHIININHSISRSWQQATCSGSPQAAADQLEAGAGQEANQGEGEGDQANHAQLLHKRPGSCPDSSAQPTSKCLRGPCGHSHAAKTLGAASKGARDQGLVTQECLGEAKGPAGCQQSPDCSKWWVLHFLVKCSFKPLHIPSVPQPTSV